MASKKVAAALLKQKEAKQKKVLFLLVPVLVVLLAWQGPKTFKAFTGGNATPPATVATPTTTSAAPTPGSAPSTPGAGAAGSGGQLADTDLPPSALVGQLTNFSVFPGRDPFSGGPGSGSGSGTTTTDGSGTTTSATPTSAQLEINGGREDVSIGDKFPKSTPLFKLVSVTAGSVLISLASGDSFTDGKTSEELKLGATLVFDGDDGSSFTIKLVSVGSN